MSIITATRTISSPAMRVFVAARDVERFPEVLPNISKVSILEDDGNGTIVTRWEGSFKVGPLERALTWSERDVWDEHRLRCDFKLIEGDMKRYEGSWTFANGGGECRVELVVDFELGIPLLGPMIIRIIDKLMQQNCDELLEALAKLSTSE